MITPMAFPRLDEVCIPEVATTRQAIEASVLVGLKDKLFAPELVAEFRAGVSGKCECHPSGRDAPPG